MMVTLFRRFWPKCWLAIVAGLLLFPGAACRQAAPPPRPAQSGPEETGAPQRGAADSGTATRDELPDAADTARAAAEPVAVAEPNELGVQLYARHCAACHGADGDGRGIAAAYVFPKPRDLQAGRFRLISTANNVPTRDDLRAVLLRGMPGSSMPPWSHLSQVELEALVDEVLRLRALGARRYYVRLLREEEGLTEEEIAEDEDIQREIAEYVTRFTTPGESTVVPEIGEPTEGSLVRAKVTYARFGCLQCHGPEGKGDGVQKMVDDEGYATAPRDFTAGIFKGGSDPASLYRRIAYGMPGTPMPGASQMQPAQMIDLVHFIRSMSSEEARQAAVLNRETIRVRRVASLPATSDASQWSDMPVAEPRMTPLWWRDGAAPDLQVQAAHDGQTIAVRISWNDAAPDETATRSEAFEDAVALELYQGESEPFIGMGDPQSPIDVWFWDGDRQRAADVEDENPRIVVDIYPFSEEQVATAEFQREGTRRENQPAISLPAEASGNAIVPPGRESSGASNLTVGGPGSSTFRVPMSQLTEARGRWEDGRWTVLMTRSMPVASPGDGVTLRPGQRLSAAFAVWDGSAQDRDGKKLITIWQDLVLDE